MKIVKILLFLSFLMGQEAYALLDQETVVNYYTENQNHAVLRTLHRELARMPKSSELDSEELEKTVFAAACGELSEWETTPKGRLALILLLDQAPRGLWNRTKEAYQFDALAIQVSLKGIENGDDKLLSPIEKLFFYLPLVHSEDLLIQSVAVQKIRDLEKESSFTWQPFFDEHYEMALLRKDLISKFGRFPQRNEFLGRLSTQDELQAIRACPLKP